MARPSKLTPEVTKRLTEAIRAGNYYEAACAYAGIHYSTFRKMAEDCTVYMMEIDPVYCDVIVKRWENFTGQKAVLAE